jgi:hypothetical protein
MADPPDFLVVRLVGAMILSGPRSHQRANPYAIWRMEPTAVDPGVRRLPGTVRMNPIKALRHE